MRLRLEWDAGKAALNLAKHGVDFEEAGTVLGDPLSQSVIDEGHSTAEETRYIAVGYSIRHRLLLVVYCEREDRFRIISARPATRGERDRYEKK